jgi:hypothetical protein
MKTIAREAILDFTLRAVLNTVTVAKVHSHFAHMMSFFPAILALHDI